MALGDPYVTVEELKEHTDIPDRQDDTALEQVIAAISRNIERFCFRQFNQAGTATARSFYAETPTWVTTQDFHTTTGLVVKVDTGGDGGFATTIDSANYTLEPLDGIVDGQTGHPWRRIMIHAGTTFPCGTRPGVQVTADWGWAAVPADVKRAAILQATKLFRRKHAPDGVLGFGDFVVRVGTRLDPDIEMLLTPYRLPPPQG